MPGAPSKESHVSVSWRAYGRLLWAAMFGGVSTSYQRHCQTGCMEPESGLFTSDMSVLFLLFRRHEYEELAHVLVPVVDNPRLAKVGTRG